MATWQEGIITTLENINTTVGALNQSLENLIVVTKNLNSSITQTEKEVKMISLRQEAEIRRNRI